ncbi:hypothetical protein DYJ26_26390 [Salmonella enterica]|nr:hypothetical protein [Salmonella enterica]ECV1143354.1 hypothetical protein [Salmonella enterica subsp. enterica]EBL0008383.1 hypothetical protein [Salmonella enterica]EBQ7118701.1 hypothetical protein [Salmonella enterica]EEJ1963928.1 hypothetical protein [Salmonella enterica]
MKRLYEIERMVDDIEKDLDRMYPHYKTDKDISDKVTALKEYAQAANKEIQEQLRRGELNDFEKAFIEPAIFETYMKAIDKIRKGAKPSQQLANHIFETKSTISYWMHLIKDHNEKDL